ncbi:50S ribosomal protein L35 [Patescibacteria group bacterium]
MAKKPKTIKAISKRFKTTKRGKVIKIKSGQNHLNAKERGKTTRQKRNDINLAKSDAKEIKKLLK